MIDNREDGVKSLRLWEVCYQIHSHHLEGSRMGVCRDWLQWGLSVSSAWFILLADGASPYIAFCEVLHVFSLVGLAEEMYSIRYAWVTCEGMVVIRS